MYLYLSKLANPLYFKKEINLKDYEELKIEFNEDFISGIALACFEFSIIENICKFVLASNDKKKFYSIYDYAKKFCDLKKYVSNSPGNFFFKLKKKQEKYINFENKDFPRGWIFIFDHFEKNLDDYISEYRY